MTILRKHIPRWTYASVAKYFIDNIPSIPIFVHPQIPRNTQNLDKYLELRMAGPHLYEVSKNDWLMLGDIYVLASVQQTEDTYDIYDLVGRIQAVMKTIDLYRYGDGVDDDSTWWACWYLQQNPRDTIESNMFGRIEKDTPLAQAYVAGSYKTGLQDLE